MWYVLWCVVVLLYLRASSAESSNIRTCMPLLNVGVKRKRSLPSLALQDAPVLSGDGADCLANLDCHFKDIAGLSMSAGAEA